MNVVRHAEAVFVGALAIAFAGAFVDSSYRGAQGGYRAAAEVETRRVAQLIAVPSVPVVIVRARRMTAEEKAHADPAPAVPLAGARI